MKLSEMLEPLNTNPTPDYPITTITLMYCRIERTSWGCITRFPDGTSYGAHPHDTHHYHVVSHRCGYGDDVLAFCREHEFAHAFVQERLHGRPSPVVWGLAHNAPVAPAAAVEEELSAQAFQRWLRAGERPIVGGVDWDALAADARVLLEDGACEAAPMLTVPATSGATP